MTTALTRLIKDLELLQTQTFTVTPETVIEMANNYLGVERGAIEQAYDDAKNYPSDNCNGSKYYFMNYINND